MSTARSAVIAVVDNEVSVRRALSRLLGAYRYDVRVFASGDEFLNTLPHCRYDCLILDLHMPGLTGLDVLQSRAVLESRVPTVIITAYDEPGTRQNCISAGAADCLCKPFDDGELLEALKEAMRTER